MKKYLLIMVFFYLIKLSGITVLAPDNPASLPLLIAASNLPELEVKLFSSHIQAHSQFLSGKVPLLLTGFAVGDSFARRGVPVRLLASWIKDLNYLITADSFVQSFSDLENEKLYFPFQDSPIEKMSLWLTEQEEEGLSKKIEVGYLPFASTLELMRQDKIRYAVMPVSAAMQIVDDRRFFLAFSLDEKWQQITGMEFYPQLCLFGNPDMCPEELLVKIYSELELAVDEINNEPEDVIRQYGGVLSTAENIQKTALEMMTFEFMKDPELSEMINIYYRKTGIKPPPESFYGAD